MHSVVHAGMMDTRLCRHHVPIDAQTRMVTLLGDPVEHSLSPLIHNTAFAAQDLNLIYTATRVRPARVQEAVRGLLGLDFLGANVTVPHKQTVIPYLHELSRCAKDVGAVNTIVCRHADGVLFGDNTDVGGFLAPLLGWTDRLRGMPMTIFGSGGAARAIAYALLTTFEPSRLTLAARRPEAAEKLASDLTPFDPEHVIAAQDLRSAREAVRQARLVVNATPLGMHPDTGTTPWPQEDDFGADHIVYDVVYNPRPTRLLREAKRRGATPVGGLKMLVSQAAASYAQWTGMEMPLEQVRSVLRNLHGEGR